MQVATLQANYCGQRHARVEKRGSRETVQALLQLSPRRAQHKNTKTRRLCAASAAGVQVPPRTDLMCSRLVFRLIAMAAARNDTEPCASRLCLLSMARALPAEHLLRKSFTTRSTHGDRHRDAARRTAVFEPQTCPPSVSMPPMHHTRTHA